MQDNGYRKEVILCKYGEIVLKGANRKYFEDQLLKSMRYRSKNYGNFEIYRAQSTIYIDPKDESCDIDGMFEAARRVFGIVSVSRAAVCEKNSTRSSRSQRLISLRFWKGNVLSRWKGSARTRNSPTTRWTSRVRSAARCLRPAPEFAWTCISPRRS